MDARILRWARDRELMAQAAARVPEAQEEVVMRVLGRTRALCRALLQSEADIADAVQTCIEELLKSAPRFRGDCTLETWAERITVRRAIRHARRSRWWRLAQPLEEDDLTRAPPAPSVDEALPRPLQTYLDRLPMSRRHVLVLRYRLEYSIDEIAELTELGRDTVKYRLKQGLAELRALIRRDLGRRPTGGKS